MDDTLLADMKRLEDERSPGGALHWREDILLDATGTDEVIAIDHPLWSEPAELAISDGYREWLALCTRFVPAAIMEIERLAAENAALRSGGGASLDYAKDK